MPLTAGDRLGPCEIISLIGKGGMGEVYSAHDPRTGRDVAIKVSAEGFNERFDREVRAVAALNHPNICTLFDVGPNYLVMELVEGESPQGPMPLETAMNYARQIAAALEEAHEKGIVHRDLKPGNIKIKPDGTVKVLDFGLAKVGGTPATQSENSPTISMAATQAGMILGTAAYMAPEQAKGKPIDRRADIWAFGVVLHEMLTGERLFQHDDLTETLAAVVMKAPELEGAPVEVRRLLRKCLEKDPKKRLRDIGDAWELLQETPASPATATPSRPALRWVWPAIATILVVVAGVVSFIHFREQPPKLEVTRFAVPAPEKTSFGSAPPAISPDGRTLAFTANGPDGRGQIWLKPMNSLEAHALAGTDGANSPLFWSPDGRSLAFSGGTINRLMKIDVAGGPAQTLCPATAGAPVGAWSSNGVIVFRDRGGLMQVPAGGGTCAPLTKLDSKGGEVRHTAPSFLPDGRHFLYLRVASKAEDSGVYLGALDSKPEAQNSARIVTGTSPVKYVPSADASHGYLMFLREGALMAQPFDAGSLSLAGDAVPVAERVGASFAGDLSLFSTSASGTLVYRGGDAGAGRQLTWYDRGGKPLGPLSAQGTYNTLSISPDGKRVAFQRTDTAQANDDIWVHDLAQGTTNRLTFDLTRDFMPVWSPDGSRIVWSSQRDGADNLYQKTSNLAGDETALLKSPQPKFPQDWSHDGRFLLYSVGGNAALDLWVLPLQGEAKPTLFLGTQFAESQGRFSPDDRYIAYVSNESGRLEVYVRPFSPDGKAGGQQMVSQGGGSQPLWRRDGKELFYIAADSKVMAVPVSTAPTFQRGTPVALFTVPIYGGGLSANLHRWAVMPDGQKFLINSVLSEDASEPITVVQNWTELLKK